MFLRIFFLFLFLAIQANNPTQEKALLTKYNQAIAYYESPQPTAESDSIALDFLTQIMNDPLNSSLSSEVILDIYEKAGNLYLINNDFEKAISAYREGVFFNYKEEVLDTLFFASNLFLGESYYRVSKADSSIFFLKNAEKLLSKKNSKLEASRLYNSLGVIYYESGNYIQSINYFNQARDLSVGDKSFSELDEYLQYAEYSFLNNIGSSLMGLSQLDSALKIYQEMLSFGINDDRSLSQISEVYLEKSEPDSAFYYLNLISSEEIKNSISFQNQLAEVSFLKNDFESSKEILKELIKANSDIRENNFQLGNTFLLLGKIAFEERKFEDAIKFFHQSVIEIDGVFEDENVLSNPLEFSLGFATFQLFESVSRKANSLMELYLQTKDEKYKKASIETFQTAFSIAFQIANYYDNDEARIFLADYALKAYEDAIKYLYNLYQISGNYEEIVLLFEWVEKNKATSLDLSLKEKKVKRNLELPTDLLQKERDLQFSISRLQQQISATNDNNLIEQYQAELRSSRLALSRLIDQLNEIPEYMQAKLADERFDIKSIQNNILDRNAALVSFFETDEEIYIFLLDNKKLTVNRIEKKEELTNNLKEFKRALKEYQPGVRYQKGNLGAKLHEQFLSLSDVQWNKYSNLIVIPHGVLMDLPFAALETESGKFLVEQFTISYQYSVEFLTEIKNLKFSNENKIAFAPFSSNFWAEDDISLNQLPQSQIEIDAISENKFSDELATKQQFLEIAPNSEIIHLATHALSDPNDPSQAFIAFYPGDNSSRLFTHEIYNLDLESTSLVFLSACETNAGLISQSEGVLSISRAFSFAGCPNIVTTLWKAEDLATAYISTRFYHHLDKGSGYADALRLAQLDLLSDPQMSQFHHPSFWSHLVFIGNHQPRNSMKSIIWYVIAILLSALLFLFYLKQKKSTPKGMDLMWD
ncbi:CHAT domain-containing protein [Belliella pelovolcani]|uniref:CHAT domain-containing protein n=1 Tax=Belliella pelovolcani TaxID=529505 RepID=UPI00391B1B54